MTGVQLGLLAASLVVQREPWVLPTPPEPQAQAQEECSGDECTASFSPNPEPNAGNILRIAMVLNLPAVFLGAVLHLVAVLIHFPHPPGEPSLLGFSAVFVPLIWYWVGRWVDNLAPGAIPEKTNQPNLQSVWTILARTAVWILFAMMLLSFLVEHHRESGATKFVMAITVLWTGAYLAAGFLGDRLRTAQHHAPAE